VMENLEEASRGGCMSSRTFLWLKRLGLVLAGVVVLLLVSVKAAALAARNRGEERSYPMTRRLLRRLNPVAVWAIEEAGMGSHNGVLYHIGRKSGREYATPLCMVTTSQGYISPATFGSHTDWLRNLKANPQSRVVVDKKPHDTVAEVIGVEDAIRYAGGTPGCHCWEDPNLTELVLLRPTEAQGVRKTA
jgi:deazaflavin-dependent oxidoreductase (nitroreductase family)